MSYDDSFIPAGGDDEDKLVPEWGRSADEQIIWVALGVLALMAALFFGASRCGDDAIAVDGIDPTELLGESASTIDGVLDGESALGSSAVLFAGSQERLDKASSGPYTVFAPSDDAWDSADIDPGDLSDEDVTANQELHIVEGEYTLKELVAAGTLTTIAGEKLTFSDDTVNGLEISDANMAADNGIVHTIEGILGAAPDPEPTAAPEPTAVPEPEPTAVPEPTPVPEPEPTAVPEPEPTAVPEPEPELTIAGLASETPELSSVTSLIVALGLDSQLGDADAGPFTVFAPNNSAIEDAADLLANLDSEDQSATLSYHVVEGIVDSVDVVPGARFETLSGETLVIGGDGSLPGGFSVVTADLSTDNGLVHVIDGVMVPPQITLRNLTSAIADLDGIQFDVNSPVIRPGSYGILDNAANVLSTLPEGTVVEVAGHTDSDGDDVSNQALSEARAASVVEYLVGKGVDRDLLSPVGYGETRLKVDPETSPADKQQNRRIEFTRPSAG